MNEENFSTKNLAQAIEVEIQELINLVIDRHQFEYRSARIILNLLNYLTSLEIKSIIGEAFLPYSHKANTLLYGERLIRNAHCYEKLINLGLSSKDIIKYPLQEWYEVIQFMTKENVMQISGMMDDPKRFDKIKIKWGSIENNKT